MESQRTLHSNALPIHLKNLSLFAYILSWKCSKIKAKDLELPPIFKTKHYVITGTKNDNDIYGLG